MITLYSYFRSSTSYRVRMALLYKGIPHKIQHVDLRDDHHKNPVYTYLNPQGLVPTLVVSSENAGESNAEENVVLSQSLVILDYVEQHFKNPPLLPENDTTLMWFVRQWTQFLACEMHPLNNLRVLRYLEQALKVTETQKNVWYHHWLREGFQKLEEALAPFSTPFAVLKTPTWLDLCLIPQMYNARRFGFELAPYPRLIAIEQQCLAQPWCQGASPDNKTSTTLET